VSKSAHELKPGLPILEMDSQLKAICHEGPPTG